ncbi:YggT family protein [Agrococcus casei]|uniref:YggT family protein n=1 Tax=Agrococcus casei TaxID=343512 RepID=UPI002286CB6E
MCFFILWARVIIDFVTAIRPDWKPKKGWLTFFVIIWKVTDPPVKFLRRRIKPVRMGGVQLDLSILVLFVALFILMNIARWIAVL